MFLNYEKLKTKDFIRKVRKNRVIKNFWKLIYTERRGLVLISFRYITEKYEEQQNSRKN